MYCTFQKIYYQRLNFKTNNANILIRTFLVFNYRQLKYKYDRQLILLKYQVAHSKCCDS